MPPLGSISHGDLIRYLKLSGFSGPYSGGKYLNRVKGELKITIPNPHPGDISKLFLLKILKQAGISKEEWEFL
ncbi:MAG TPA: type II toxin-antitoxin system HicA family toxin [Coleofasciculaceae cyanobacterium]